MRARPGWSAPNESPVEMAAYLEACMDEAIGDATFIAKAPGDTARAQGMTHVARDAGLSRESLYKALSRCLASTNMIASPNSRVRHVSGLTGGAMTQTCTAVVVRDADRWIGWTEDVPGVNCQESTRESLWDSLWVTLTEAIELNRTEARSATARHTEIGNHLTRKICCDPDVAEPERF